MQKYIQTTDNIGPSERSKDIDKGIKDVTGNGNTEDNPVNEDTSDVSNNLSNIKVLNPRG